jgi:hypothetical protein
MPLRRRYARMALNEYPLSPTILPGKSLGRPLPLRLMLPCSINCSNTVHSCCWPGVSTNVTGLPLPSHLTCILVPNPPRLQPKASVSGPSCGSPFLHLVPSGLLRRFDEREYWCRLHSELSIGPRQAYLPFAEARQAPGPKHLPYATGKAWRKRSWESRIAQASPPTGHLS